MAQNQLFSILLKLFQVFCGGNQHQNQQQQQQQQYGQYPGQQQQQQYQQYPPQQQQQQQYYPPQQGQGQSWSQVAGGHNQQQQQYQQQPNGQYPSSHQQHNGGYPSKPHIPAGGVTGPHHPAHQNQDQINATNDRYEDLRSRARRAGDEAHRCFAQSQEAYQRGDGGRAHDLSQEGKRHQAEQDKLDDEASEWIFTENNRSSPPYTVDLHGLYVKEAIERTEAAIAKGQREGAQELRIIVGKGIHSQGHVAKIKPAVEGMMQKYNLSAHLDPDNTGVLIVDLTGSQANGRTRDAGGLVDEMQRRDGEGCTIM